MGTEDTQLAPLRRFRLTAVRYTLAAIAVLAVAAGIFDVSAAQGVLLGGLSGVLGFWIIAVRLEKIANLRGTKIKFSVLTWSILRFALYGAALYKAYTLDPQTHHGLLGAVAGILSIRFVLIFLGLTGLDLAQPRPLRHEGQGD